MEEEKYFYEDFSRVRNEDNPITGVFSRDIINLFYKYYKLTVLLEEEKYVYVNKSSKMSISLKIIIIFMLYP